MDDYALVLNAGSSSLKFCVFNRPGEKDWQVAARGQIEGIGTSPRLCAKDAQGVVLVNNSLDVTVSDGHAAIDALASWLRSKWYGAHVLGIGHRVVHGGMRYGQPVLVTRQVLSHLYEVVPLAPLHQPYNLAAIDAVFERLPDVPQVACFDTGFHSGHSAGSRSDSTAKEHLQIGPAAIRFPRPVLRVHCFRLAGGCPRDCERQGHRRASGKRRESVRLERRKKR